MKKIKKVRKEKVNVFKQILNILHKFKRPLKFLAGLVYDWSNKQIKQEKKKVVSSQNRTKQLKHGRRTRKTGRRLE